MATPGGPLEICFSFDTTVSMTTYVNEVKARLQDMVQRMKSDIPGIKLSMFAHGDYYYSRWDNKSDYVTIHTDFTDDVAKLCEFIKSATPTNGGDWKECYELVLREAREMLSWSPGANKVMVMIGDAIPHEVDAPVNALKIDWKVEVQKLLDMGVRTYGVFCQTPDSHDYDIAFYKNLAKRGHGDYLTLNKFDSIFDFMMAICYREKGEDALHAYEKEVMSRGDSTAREVNKMFTTLKKSASNASTSSLRKSTSTVTSKPLRTNTRSTKTTLVKTKAKTVQARLTKASARKPRTATQKKTVTKKTAAKVSAKTSKQATNKAEVRRRLRRERVPQRNFGLREFRWSAWKLVLCSYGPGPYWKERTDHVGYRNTFINVTPKKRALYEFAVQIGPGRQKTVVFSKLSNGFSLIKNWETELLNSKCLQSQIDKLLTKEFTIHARRLVINAQRTYDKVVNIHGIYDYAWDSNMATGKSREVDKQGETISYELEDD